MILNLTKVKEYLLTLINKIKRNKVDNNKNKTKIVKFLYKF